MASRLATCSVMVAFLAFFGGCGDDELWPPLPKNQQEKLMIESTLRAVAQMDGWTEVACVVERQKRNWRVQAWRIVHPEAQGRNKCAPWAVRGITLDDDAKVLAYENHL